MRAEGWRARLGAAWMAWEHAERRRTGTWVATALALAPVVAIVGLLAVVLWISVRQSVVHPSLTLDHYREVFSDPFATRAMLNTAVFTGVATVTALVLGLPFAWVVERSDLGARSTIYTVTTIGAFVPGFFTAMGWTLFLHPRIGMLNQWLMDWFDLDRGPINIVSLGGMGVVQGFTMSGIVFLFTATSLRSMDGSLEESAVMCGARPLTVAWRITLPLAWPGIVAALLFVVTLSVSAFDVPLMMGMPNRIHTFSTFLVTLTGETDEGVPPYGTIAAFGSLMIVVALVLSWWYRRMATRSRRYAVVTGRSTGRKLVPLGRWRYLVWALLGAYFGLTQLMPLVLLTWAALLPYLQPLSLTGFEQVGLENFRSLPWPLVRRGAGNTVLLMLVTPIVTFALSVAMSWVVLRTRTTFRSLVDFAAFLPVGVPPVVFGFAALLTVLNVDLPLGIELYGTVPLLIAMYTLVSLGFGTRTTNTALIQVHQDLEDAAKVSGASHWAMLRRIVVPLLRPAIGYGALWVALLVSRDITLANVLGSGDSTTVSMVVWHFWSSGRLGQASALSLCLIAVFVPLIFVYVRRAGAHVLG